MTDADNVNDNETTNDDMSDEAPSVTAAGHESTVPEGRSSAPAATRTKAPESVQYAVIVTGGKQYRVKVGDRIAVERLADDAGSDITIDQVLMIGGDGSTRIGTPVVDGAAVTATVNNHDRGDKIVVFKYKAKKRYRRRTGHRQERTQLTITGILG